MSDHHDDAYNWARRRKLEIHPRTGAAQLVEMQQTVKEILVRQYVAGRRASTTGTLRYSAKASDDELLSYGVPEELLEYVRAATEDNYLEVAGHLPEEAAEALLQLATGEYSPSVIFPFPPEATRSNTRMPCAGSV